MFSPFRIASAQFEPDTGQLLLQGRSPAQPRYLLTSWEQGLNLFQESGHGWVDLNQGPNILLLGSSHPSSVQSAVDSLIAAIPEDIQKFACPFKWRQLTLLRLLRTSPQAEDLTQSCPLLLWLLADRINEDKLTLSMAAQLTLQRRDAILGHVLGHGSRSLVKFLNRLKPSAFDHHEVRLLYRVLGNQDTISALRHCQEIHCAQLMVVMEQVECARIPMVRSLLEQPGQSPFLFRRIKSLVKGCLQITRGYDTQNLWASLARCHTVAQLEDLNDQLHLRHNQMYVRQKAQREEEAAAQAALSERIAATRRQQEREDHRRMKSVLDRKQAFPLPPFSGNDVIKPITTPGALRYEGSSKVMDNCVGGRDYIRKVVKGESYIYRVYSPQRCTLEIERTPSGHWRIGQLKLRHNNSPKPETRNLVQQWLDHENHKTRGPSRWAVCFAES